MRSRVAYAAAVWTGLYGSLKLYWALGGTALRDTVGLDPRLWTETVFIVFGLWGTVLLALVGVTVALATVRPWGARVPRWILVAGTWFAATILLLRAVPTLARDIAIYSGLSVPAGMTPADDRAVGWDLALWAPFFAVWGLLWLATAWRVTRTRRAAAPLKV
jgi:hypothetical protein